MNRKKTIQSKERHFNTSYPALDIDQTRERERDKKNRRQWNLSLHLQQTDQSNESSIYIDFIIGGPLQNQTLNKKSRTYSSCESWKSMRSDWTVLHSSSTFHHVGGLHFKNCNFDRGWWIGINQNMLKNIKRCASHLLGFKYKFNIVVSILLLLFSIENAFSWRSEREQENIV